MNRALLILSVLLLALVLAILWWAQSGQEQLAAVLVIKQLTIASLLLLVLGFVLWLIKSLFDSSTSFNEPESLTMRVSEDRDNKRGRAALTNMPPLPESALEARVDTQAEIDRIRAMIAEDPEKFARIVKRWIGSGE